MTTPLQTGAQLGPYVRISQIGVSGMGEVWKARDTMVVDAELHADEEALLIAHGSNQTDLWGINLYPGLEGDDFVEFDSMINLRPSRGNRSRGVEDPAIRERIRRIINDLVIR